jgi:hypothetical protein
MFIHDSLEHIKKSATVDKTKLFAGATLIECYFNRTMQDQRNKKKKLCLAERIFFEFLSSFLIYKQNDTNLG